MAKFEGVEDTLFIPLAVRVFASKNYQELFYDEKALELEKYIPNDSISKNTDEYFTLTSISRFYEFDQLVKDFIAKHKNCNIVSLGCGLETMYFRLKSNEANFYEIDFPSVIKQRKLVLGENENEKLIGCDILDYKWMDEISKTTPTLFIVAGVFQYLHYQDITKLLIKIKSVFENAEIAFDVTNKMGLKGANNYVKKTGNADAMMHFYLNNIKPFVKEVGASVIKVIPFFKNSKKILKNKLKLTTKITCFFGDKLGFTRILYLKLN